MKGIGSLPLVAMFCLTVIQPLSGSAQQSGAPMAAYWLQYVCSQDSNDSAAGFCQGAIEAFYSVMEDACVPSEVLPQEIKQSVLEALRATRFRHWSRLLTLFGVLSIPNGPVRLHTYHPRSARFIDLIRLVLQFISAHPLPLLSLGVFQGSH